MHKRLIPLCLIWISVVGLTACTSTKSRVFGDGMPRMTEVVAGKFGRRSTEAIARPQRLASQSGAPHDNDFQWLVNPTMTLYVFAHLSPSGHPVPGYTTFFRLYSHEIIAQPGEHGGWE